MRDEEIFVTLLLCSGLAVVVAALRYSHLERVQRMRILENALQDPKVDGPTRQELIRSLDRKNQAGVIGAWRTWLVENLMPRRVFAALAWGAIVVGGLVAIFGSRYEYVTGIVLLSLGVGVLALPFVLRELDARAARR